MRPTARLPRPHLTLLLGTLVFATRATAEDWSDAGAPESVPRQPLVRPEDPASQKEGSGRASEKPEEPVAAPAAAAARAEPPTPPPTRHVPGAYALVAWDNSLGLGGLANTQSVAFANFVVRPGFGFDAGPVKLDATAFLSLFVPYAGPASSVTRVAWSDLHLWLTAPEVARLGSFSISPSVGFQVPTGSQSVVTVLNTGARLEWVFKEVEASYRLEVGHPLYQPSRCDQTLGQFCVIPMRTQWSLDQALMLEVHPHPRFSVGAKLVLDHDWGASEVTPGFGPAAATAERNFLGELLFVTCNVTDFAGATLGISRYAPALDAAGGLQVFAVDNNTSMFVSVWFRSSPSLSRTWAFW